MPPWISTSPAATFGQNVMQSYESKDYDTLEIEGTKCIQMHPNASKYTRCKQTAFKRAVLLQLSQHSVRSCCCESSCAMLWHYRTYRISTVVVKICHNISQYCALCQNMSPSSTIVRPAFSLTSGLYCKRKSMVWKTFLAEELMQKWHPDSGD